MAVTAGTPHYELVGYTTGDGIKFSVAISDMYGNPLGGNQADDLANDLLALLAGLTGVTGTWGQKKEEVTTSPFPDVP